METTELLHSSEFWAGFNLAISACALAAFLYFVIKSLRLDLILKKIFPSLDKERDKKIRQIEAAKLLAKHGIIVYRYSYHPCLSDLHEILSDRNDRSERNEIDWELNNAWFEFAGNMDSYVFLSKEKVIQGTLFRLDIPEALKHPKAGSHLKIIK